jgi:hypothetical protein
MYLEVKPNRRMIQALRGGSRAYALWRKIACCAAGKIGLKVVLARRDSQTRYDRVRLRGLMPGFRSPRKLVSRLPALSAALCLGLAPASADIRVEQALIDGGDLDVTGSADPGSVVVLDGRFETIADGSGRFAFKLVYHPESCIVELTSPTQQAIGAVVAYCGPKGVVPAGPWSNTRVYKADQLVTYDGSVWRALRGVPENRVPGSSGTAAFWEKFVSRGAQGARGLKGDSGSAGPRGDPGPPGAKGEAGRDASGALAQFQAHILPGAPRVPGVGSAAEMFAACMSYSGWGFLPCRATKIDAEGKDSASNGIGTEPASIYFGPTPPSGLTVANLQVLWEAADDNPMLYSPEGLVFEIVRTDDLSVLLSCTTIIAAPDSPLGVHGCQNTATAKAPGGIFLAVRAKYPAWYEKTVKIDFHARASFQYY